MILKITSFAWVIVWKLWEKYFIRCYSISHFSKFWQGFARIFEIHCLKKTDDFENYVLRQGQFENWCYSITHTKIWHGLGRIFQIHRLKKKQIILKITSFARASENTNRKFVINLDVIFKIIKKKIFHAF